MTGLLYTPDDVFTMVMPIFACESLHDSAKWPTSGDDRVFFDEHHIVDLEITLGCLPFCQPLHLLKVFCRPSFPNVVLVPDRDSTSSTVAASQT